MRHFFVVPMNEPRGEGGGWEDCFDSSPGALFFPVEIRPHEISDDVREGYRTREEAQKECWRLNQE